MPPSVAKLEQDVQWSVDFIFFLLLGGFSGWKTLTVVKECSEFIWGEGLEEQSHICQVQLVLHNSYEFCGLEGPLLTHVPNLCSTFSSYWKLFIFQGIYLPFGCVLSPGGLTVSSTYLKGSYFRDALHPTPKQQAWFVLAFQIPASFCWNFSLC